MDTNPFDHPDRIAYHLEVAEEHSDKFALVLEFAANLGIDVTVVDTADA